MVLVNLLDNWILLALIKTIATVFILLLQKSIVPIDNLYPTIVSIAVGIFMFFYLIFFQPIENIKQLFTDGAWDRYIWKLMLMTILIVIGIFSGYQSLQKSSNPAYVRAFVGLEILMLLLIGYLFFGYDVTLWKLLGCLFVIIGVSLLVL